MVYRTTPRMAARKRAHRARLLAVATRLFGRHGYHATTVPMIVAKARSSTGSFYFYFRDKEDVFAAVLEALAARLAAELNQAIAAAGSNQYRQMRAAVERLVNFLAGHPEEARILIVESSGLGGRLEQLRRGVVASHTRSVELGLLRAQGGRRPAAAAALMARCWVGAVHEAVYAWLEQPPEKRLPARTVAAVVARFNLRGVGAPAGVLA